jgi:uncharacterized membrane protein (UPF0127 family)
LLVAALVVLAASAGAAPAVVPLTLPSGRVIDVEVMISDQDRALGVMFRPSMPADHGVLLVFRGSGFHSIWMKNCRFPIDVIWLDEERRVVHVAENVPPCKADPCPSYEPLRRATYVLEVNAGQAREDEATVGATLSFELPR